MEYTLRLCEEILDKLEQILESATVITSRIKETDSVETLMNSPWGVTTLDSCIMRLQVIGELVRAIDNQTEGQLFVKFPSIPWKSVIGLRNIISHEYANIDYDMIWEVFTRHLQPLAEEVVRIEEYIQTEIYEIEANRHI